MAFSDRGLCKYPWKRERFAPEKLKKENVKACCNFTCCQFLHYTFINQFSDVLSSATIYIVHSMPNNHSMYMTRKQPQNPFLCLFAEKVAN